MRPKTFNISLHRCGTQSIHYLMNALGLNTKHWPQMHGDVDFQNLVVGREDDPDFVADCLRPLIDDFDTVSDVPICSIYEPLAKIYPDAKFIALNRPTNAWISSVRRHIGSRPLDPFERAQYWKYLDQRPSTLLEVGDDELAYMKVKHYKDIEKFFSNTNRIYIGNLGDESVGTEICRFLGFDPRILPNQDYLRDLVR